MNAHKIAVCSVLAIALFGAAACDDAPSNSDITAKNQARDAAEDAFDSDPSRTEDTQDTQETSDIDGQRDPDGDGGEDARVGPNPVWEQFENTCAPDRDVVAPEQSTSPAVPSDVGEVPRLVWQQDTLCPEHEEHSGLDWETQDDFAYGKFTINGQQREVVLVVNHGMRGDTLAPVAYAVALIDAHTGESLKCIDLPSEATDTEDTLRIVSGDGIYVPYVTRRGEAASEGDIPDMFGLVAYNPEVEEEEIFHRTIEIFRNSGYGRVKSVVTNDGQVVVNWKNRRLVSFDYRTGEIYWTIGAAAFGVPHEEFNLQGPYLLPGEELLVKVRTNGALSRTFSVDRCANTTEKMEMRGAKWPLVFGEDYLLWNESNLEFHKSDGTTVEFSTRCDNLVDLGARRVACSLRSGSDPKIILKVLELDSGDITQATIGAPDDAKYWMFDGIIAAGAEDTLITAGEYSMETGTTLRRFYFLSTTTLEVRGHFDLEVPDVKATNASSMTPLLLPDGKMIVGAWGRLYAIQTDVGGLANAVYPRGLLLGGNENRGYVVPR